jgi:8-oxo-dGTP pyrophosphatase MutT (NUDIX family)
MPADQDRPVRRGVVGIVVRRRQLLVIQRSNCVEAPGAFCFPGGAVEPGETEPEALRREFQEELGVIARPLRRLWQSQTDWNVHLAWWSAELDSPETMRPEPSEVAAVHWLTLSEIAQLPELLSSNQRFLEALQRGEFSLPLAGEPS